MVGDKYRESKPDLFYVPNDKKKWDTRFAEYNPPTYTAKSVLHCPDWADPQSTSGLKFNQIDGGINRVSLCGTYRVVCGVPLNPKGRIGIQGRGRLGKWGPNHAVDIVISRIDLNGEMEFVCIRRKSGQMAFPGGFVDNGEQLPEAMVREAMEEVFNIKHEATKQRALEWLTRIISTAPIIWKGYVACGRNTDNAWIETNAVLCLEKLNDIIDFPVIHGSDAEDAFWIPLSRIDLHTFYHKKILNAALKYVGK